jgi:small subunit ribosomal protein S18
MSENTGTAGGMGPGSQAPSSGPEGGLPRPGGYEGPRGPGGPSGPGGPGGRPMRPKGKYAPRRKVCAFCVDKVSHIDYKDLMRLRRFLSDRAKIEPARKTGTCAKHQRRLATALKRARHLALLPYTGEHIRLMGGVIAPVPGQPLTPDRPFPPRDSFGPSGSVPGGNRQQSQGGEGGPGGPGPGAPGGPDRGPAPVAAAVAVPAEAAAEPAEAAAPEASAVEAPPAAVTSAAADVPAAESSEA